MMKQVTIISGKGGTGKTSLTASFASLASDVVLADCDVDAADLHLLVDPQIVDSSIFQGFKVAEVDGEKCTRCSVCVSSCEFDAISENIVIDYNSCEGCGVCGYVCPVKAIDLVPRDSGYIYESTTRFGPMVHARLNTAEEASGKLVTMVRSRAVDIARSNGKNLVLIDGPPGIGCPVISSITGVDLVVIVTEPTFSGIHDMKRVIDVAKHFRIPYAIIINKSDINMEKSEEIVGYCKDQGIALIGLLPYDEVVTKAMVSQKTIIEETDGTISSLLKECWERIMNLLEKQG
jgi:MinD superfamily P-loop ATPase